VYTTLQPYSSQLFKVDNSAVKILDYMYVPKKECLVLDIQEICMNLRDLMHLQGYVQDLKSFVFLDQK
jgi:hypothetical protein